MVLKWAFKNFWKCVFVLFFFINGLSAQVNSSEIISVADGLSEGMVFDIIQDKKGFIWIAVYSDESEPPIPVQSGPLGEVFFLDDLNVIQRY
jgi:hypothetical protein